MNETWYVLNCAHTRYTLHMPRRERPARDAVTERRERLAQERRRGAQAQLLCDDEKAVARRLWHEHRSQGDIRDVARVDGGEAEVRDGR